MTVHRSAFSERLFEFVFNADFLRQNGATVIGLPHIPSQDEEEWLGYDVAFDIDNGAGVVESLALQHKVARLVDGPGSHSNRDFRKAAGSKYLAFPVDPFQFNTIHALVSEKLPGVEFYYCAPLFVDKPCLDKRYAAQDLGAHSVYFDIRNTKPLDESESHSMVYLQDGSKAWVFSERQDVQIFLAAQKPQQEVLRNSLSIDQISHIYNRSFEVISEGYDRRIRAAIEREPTDNIREVIRLSEYRRSLRASAPMKQSFQTRGEGWRAIAQLYAMYLEATTIAVRAAA